jgi:hypothetical protein
MLVDARNRDHAAQLEDDQHAEREEDPVPKVRDAEYVRKSSQHLVVPRLFVDLGHGSAGGLDFLPGGAAESVSVDFESVGDFPVAQNLHGKVLPGDESVLRQEIGIDCGPGVESCQRPDLDEIEFLVISASKSPFGHPADKRHLSSLEVGGERDARSGLLALVTATGRGALSSRIASPEPAALSLGAPGRPQ